MLEKQAIAGAAAANPFAGFELAESCALYEVFESLTEQLIAFSNQPRFGDAGLGLLEDISEDFARRSRLLAAYIKAARPADRSERGQRAKIILRDAMLDTDDLSEIAAIAAVLATPERH